MIAIESILLFCICLALSGFLWMLIFRIQRELNESGKFAKTLGSSFFYAGLLLASVYVGLAGSAYLFSIPISFEGLLTGERIFQTIAVAPILAALIGLTRSSNGTEVVSEQLPGEPE